MHARDVAGLVNRLVEDQLHVRGTAAVARRAARCTAAGREGAAGGGGRAGLGEGDLVVAVVGCRERVDAVLRGRQQERTAADRGADRLARPLVAALGRAPQVADPGDLLDYRSHGHGAVEACTVGADGGHAEVHPAPGTGEGLCRRAHAEVEGIGVHRYLAARRYAASAGLEDRALHNGAEPGRWAQCGR